jgi:hypothetical protein
LVPLVISEALATRWGVGDAWLRYAVASNWSQWAMPLALAALISSLWLLDQMGLKTNSSMVAGGAVGVVCYGVALHYFLARVGLGLSRWKAGGLVALCDVVTVIVVLGPRLLALHLGPNS